MLFLRSLRCSTRTNSKVLVSSNDSLIENLALEINESLEQKLKAEAEHKKMELELRQAIANISHDLRTPLTSIMGYIQLIEDDTLSEAERKKYLDIVKNRPKALQLLIGSFYDLSRLEAGECKFQLKSINLYNLICNITTSYYKDFSSRGIEPEIDLEANTKPIIADENAVSRIFSNLIQNMLKYGSDKVSITLKQTNSYVSTVFANKAPNLKEEDVPRLFERFYTDDKTRTEKSTGLGLSITKQLVEQMGHVISADLKHGRLNIEIKWKL